MISILISIIWKIFHGWQQAAVIFPYLFNQDLTVEEKEAAKERILTQFTTILESRSDIYNVAAVANNGEALINTGADRLNKYVDVRQHSWYQAALHSPTGIAVSSSHVQNAIAGSYHWVITLSSDDCE